MAGDATFLSALQVGANLMALRDQIAARRMQLELQRQSAAMLEKYRERLAEMEDLRRRTALLQAETARERERRMSGTALADAQRLQKAESALERLKTAGTDEDRFNALAEMAVYGGAPGVLGNLYTAYRRGGVSGDPTTYVRAYSTLIQSADRRLSELDKSLNEINVMLSTAESSKRPNTDLINRLKSQRDDLKSQRDTIARQRDTWLKLIGSLGPVPEGLEPVTEESGDDDGDDTATRPEWDAVLPEGNPFSLGSPSEIMEGVRVPVSPFATGVGPMPGLPAVPVPDTLPVPSTNNGPVPVIRFIRDPKTGKLVPQP